MNWSRLNGYLSQDVEPLTSVEKVWFSIGIGLFTFLFLLFFQPFGVNNYDPSETITSQFFWIMVVMGIYISVVMLVSELLIFKLFIHRSSRLNLSLWAVWSVFYLATMVFLLYNFLGNWHDLSWTSWLAFIGNIGAMAIIPLTGLVVYRRIRSLQTSISELETRTPSASMLGDHSDDLLNIVSENLKNNLSLRLHQLLYIESQDNYVAIFYLQDEHLMKELVRTTMKQVCTVHYALVRTHRSYIINLYHLSRFTGNQNRAHVNLKYVKSSIPVARTYFEELRLKVEELATYPS